MTFGKPPAVLDGCHASTAGGSGVGCRLRHGGRLVGGAVAQQGEGDACELSGEDDEDLRGGEAAGAVVLGEGPPARVSGHLHGREVEEASQLGLALLGQAAAVSARAGLAHAHIEAEEGDEGVGA